MTTTFGSVKLWLPTTMAAAMLRCAVSVMSITERGTCAEEKRSMQPWMTSLRAATTYIEWPRPAPDNKSENLPKTIPGDDAEWWYDQKAKDKRGKDRRYTGYVQRIGGTAGEKIRSELAIAA